MEIVGKYNRDSSPEGHQAYFLDTVTNFSDLVVFEGDAGKDPFFDLRMKAAIIAMAEFLDYIDQTESYQYYPLGSKLKDAFYYDYREKMSKELVLQLAKYSYFFEREKSFPKTQFRKGNWVKAYLEELGPWPTQFVIYYECFLENYSPLNNEYEIRRRVEVQSIIQQFQNKIEKFSFDADREWTRIWNLIKQTLNES